MNYVYVRIEITNIWKILKDEILILSNRKLFRNKYIIN